jgi:TetR/AcrR family transcriptional regulator
VSVGDNAEGNGEEGTCHSAKRDAPATRGRSRKYTQVLGSSTRRPSRCSPARGWPAHRRRPSPTRPGLSKAQLHYYIDSKEALYRQVLQDILTDWIVVFGFSDEAFGPRKVLGDLIHRKMVFSFDHPLRSRIFTAEMMRGAPVVNT